MKIKNLQLKNFKRFTDLTLQDIPDNAKLVLLIGSNGSGKSSVFDAFEYLANQNKKSWRSLTNYSYNKNKESISIIIETYEYGKEGLINNSWERSNKIESTSLYGRTSFRQVPRLTRTGLGNSFNVRSDDDRPPTFIDRDQRFENDLEHIFGKLLKEFFKKSDDKSEIKKEVINPINESFTRIFGDQNGTKLTLVELIPPLEGKIAEITFQKGNSTFHYNYLSAGEKEIFNILVNLVARREYFQNSVYYFDEIDLHLNTKLQYNFLKEIVENWIPQNCQLWTASHSLGFIQYAKENEQAIIFDFDDYDFDFTKILAPEPKDNADIYEIAVNKELLPELFKGKDVVFVENEDRKYYASLNIVNFLFVPEKNRDGVYHKVKSGHFKGLVDRDLLTDEDIVAIEKEYQNLKILRLYCIENYLFHPDNIEEYVLQPGKAFDKVAYIQKILTEKDALKQELLIKIATIRQGYPYFKEPGKEKSEYRKRFTPDNENFEQSKIIASYLDSKDHNQYLKSFSLKDNCKSLPERKNLNPFELSKTKWFSEQIEKIIK